MPFVGLGQIDPNILAKMEAFKRQVLGVQTGMQELTLQAMRGEPVSSADVKTKVVQPLVKLNTQMKTAGAVVKTAAVKADIKRTEEKAVALQNLARAQEQVTQQAVAAQQYGAPVLVSGAVQEAGAFGALGTQQLLKYALFAGVGYMLYTLAFAKPKRRAPLTRRRMYRPAARR